jgi:hypothetical protein
MTSLLTVSWIPAQKLFLALSRPKAFYSALVWRGLLNEIGKMPLNNQIALERRD